MGTKAYWAKSYIDAEIHDKETRLKEAQKQLQDANIQVKVSQDAVDRYSAELGLLKVVLANMPKTFADKVSEKGKE